MNLIKNHEPSTNSLRAIFLATPTVLHDAISNVKKTFIECLTSVKNTAEKLLFSNPKSNITLESYKPITTDFSRL